MNTHKRRAITVPEFLGWFLIGATAATLAVVAFAGVYEVFHR